MVSIAHVHNIAKYLVLIIFIYFDFRTRSLLAPLSLEIFMLPATGPPLPRLTGRSLKESESFLFDFPQVIKPKYTFIKQIFAVSENVLLFSKQKKIMTI